MKPLSEQLNELSDRAKKTEASVADVRDNNRAKLEARHAQLRASLDAGASQVKSSAAATHDSVSSHWTDIRGSVSDRFAGLRAKAEDRRAVHDVKKAERHAEEAAADAEDAIGLALYLLDEAEYAAVDAAIARSYADDLAAGA